MLSAVSSTAHWSTIEQKTGTATCTEASDAPSIVDFSSATPANVERTTGTSANLCRIVSFEGVNFHLKDPVSHLPISPEMGNAIAAREVASAAIYGLFVPAPEEILVNQCSSIMEGADDEKIHIASKLVDYLDFGDSLTKRQLAEDLSQQFESFTEAHSATFKNNADKAEKLTSELAELRDKKSDYLNHPWWAGIGNNPDPEFVQAYRTKAEELDRIMQEQFQLLPEALQQEMQEHLAVSQLIGDWDPINALYKNMGLVKFGDGKMQVMRVDFGSCLDIGFQGQTKESGYDTAVNQRPAAFPVLKHPFEKEYATFSNKLPKLAEKFDSFPYADHSFAISGKAEWADTTRMKIAYRCSLIMAHVEDAKDAIENIMRRTLIDTGVAQQLTPKDALINTLHARMDTLINDQCGGSNKVLAWEKNNPDLSNAIRVDLSSKLNTNIAPLGYDPNQLQSHRCHRNLETLNL